MGKFIKDLKIGLEEASAYELSGLICAEFEQEAESKEYGACSFKLNGKSIRFRIAKITPTKIGQFVTFWKRIGSGPIMPYDTADSFDFLVVSVRAADRSGQFVFPKNVLRQKGFVSIEGKGGKRAMRVYPPWDIADNPQAKKTQAWQLMYFVEMQPNFSIDQIQKLFSF